MNEKPRQPLEGIRVVDLTWVVAGPMLGHMLADMGAEVIKVESRSRLGFFRQRGVYYAHLGKNKGNLLERSLEFHHLNRNKLGITIDFKKSRGAELVKRLVKKSDILIENFSPGVLQSAGLDYKALSKIQRDLIMLSMSGAGQSGSLRDMKAFAPTISCMSGLDSLTGYEHKDVQGILSIGLADTSSAVHATIAIVAALLYRQKTGIGQYIDLSELEVIISQLGEPILDYFMNSRIAEPKGNYHSDLAPYGVYPCKENDSWISLSVNSDEEWNNLCKAAEYPPWHTDPKFSDKNKRISNKKNLDKCLSNWTCKHTRDGLLNILHQHGLAASPVLYPEDVIQEPYFKDLWTECIHPVTGKDKIMKVPWKMSGNPTIDYKSAPLLGEHNNQIFGKLLGLSKQEISQLKEDKIIY